MIQNILMYLRIVGLVGLLRAIYAKLMKSTAFFEMRVQGFRHPFLLRLPSSDVSCYEQVFIDKEYDFSVERQPEVIVDAGANIGLASIYFANRYPEARIIAIEPEKDNFELLRKNVTPYPNITPVQAALWNRNEEINMLDPGLGEWGFMAEERESGNEPPVNARHSVSAMTVDGIMKDHRLEKIDILKVDIEGAEKEVFSDTSSWIDMVDSLIVELHERMKAGCNRSFYCGTEGFEHEWTQGENVYLTRGKCIATPSA